MCGVSGVGSLSRFPVLPQHPSTFAHVGCRAPALPPVEEVWDEMCERFPAQGPCEVDPHDATAEQRRFALCCHVAANWHDARGSGNRSTLPRCIWAAIQALDPSDGCEEDIPDAADCTPPDPDSNGSGDDADSNGSGSNADGFWL